MRLKTVLDARDKAKMNKTASDLKDIKSSRGLNKRNLMIAH